MSELYAVADRIVALVDGEVRIDADVSKVSEEAVVEAITGEAASVSEEGVQVRSLSEDHSRPPGPVTLAVKQLRTKDLESVTLTAHAGRVLGLYGLIGSGRTEFLRTLVGLGGVSSGSIELFGKPYLPRTPAVAQRHGIAYLTEERKTDGIIPLRDGISNVILPVVKRYSAGMLLQPKRMSSAAHDYMDMVRVRGNREAPVSSLSGGNQQKILLARVLAQRPKLLLLDEPTKGVDIGVKQEIHRMLRRLAADQGLTVIVVSSEEEEVLAVADDVVVFVDGYCSGETTPVHKLTDADLRKSAWTH